MPVGEAIYASCLNIIISITNDNASDNIDCPSAPNLRSLSERLLKLNNPCTMTPEIRKFVTFDEEIFIEGFKKADAPWRMFAVAAVITNPWAGRFVEDLKPEIMAYGPVMGEMMTERMIALAGSGDAIEAYGKAAVVGLDGEIEHASALIHTLSDLAIFIVRRLVQKAIYRFPTHVAEQMHR